MKWNKILTFINFFFPVSVVGLTVFYEVFSFEGSVLTFFV